jgi:HK97 family phage major capsid protein
MKAMFAFVLCGALYAPAGDGGGGGGGAVLEEGEFQKKVLDFQTKQKETQDTLVEKYDQLHKDTKSAFEELTKIKNASYVSDADFLKAIQKLNLQIHRELKMANGDPVQRILQDPEKRSLLNAIVRHQCGGAGMSAELKTALGEDSSPGSTLIVDELAGDIYDTLASYGIWNTFGVRRVGTKTTKFPVKTTRATAAYVLTEGGAITEDAAKAGTSVDCTLELIAALLPVSLQLLQDSEFDVTADVLNDFAESHAYRMDWSCLQADGTADATDGGMTGVFYGGTAAVAASGNVSVQTLDLEDVTGVLLAVDPVVLTRMSKWWMHPQILIRMMSIKDLNGRPIFLTATEAPTPAGMGSILGYPVVSSFAAPTANTVSTKLAVFGDPQGLAVGMGMDFQFDGSDHFAWNTVQRTFRGVSRFGCKVRRAAAFGVLTTAAS